MSIFKKLFLMTWIVTMTLFLAASTQAKTPPKHDQASASAQAHFWDASDGDVPIHFVNPTPSDPLCLNFYVFNDLNELVECCAVGLRTHQSYFVNQETDLLSNPANSSFGFFGHGWYEVFASDKGSGLPFGRGVLCDAGAPYSVSQSSGEVWYDNEAFTDAEGDMVSLQHACADIEAHDSGTGICGL